MTMVSTPDVSTDLQAPSTADDTHENPDLRPVFLSLAILIAMLVVSVANFGLPGLYLPALAFVPVMYLILVRIAWG